MPCLQDSALNALALNEVSQVSLFLTVLGVLNCTLAWTVWLLLDIIGTAPSALGPSPALHSAMLMPHAGHMPPITGTESLGTFSDIPWGFLCASSILSLSFNFLINFGVNHGLRPREGRGH